jgi:NADPH:quinone reductase-like Zn-dependent oxidoreductase
MIEAVGAGVTAFKVGDKVMGFEGMRGCGSHAHYLTIPETRAIMTIPEGLTYEEAAACLEGAFYAASGIRYLKPKEGQKALVNGATGAIGSATVQILKTYGVQVTAVCRGEHAELVRSLGADRVIDYTREDFTKDNEQYDYVFDSVGKSTFKRCKHLLKRRGIYTSTDGFENLYLQLFNFLRGGKRVVFLPPNDILGGLHFIKALIERGSFRPVIDRQYPLESIADAYAYVAQGKKIGNVIIAMN